MFEPASIIKRVISYDVSGEVIQDDEAVMCMIMARQ